MPNWAELLVEINGLGSPYDILRRKYVKQLADYTGRNVICYYSGWLQKPDFGQMTAVGDDDKNGLMTTINRLEPEKGLDLILHTPGGDTAATESIVDYLWQKFNGDIRCFVPQMAMSAGTMIACSCKEIWMGKQSSLGPIDPQYGPIPAHGVLEEFQRAYEEITTKPETIPFWQPIIAKYPIAFIGECEKAVKWSATLLQEWLLRNMLASNPNRENIAIEIVRELIDHSVSFAHNRHLSNGKCSEIGLVVKELESDQELQDRILTVHHIYCQTLSATAAFKIIENNLGVAYIQQAHQFIVPANGVIKQQSPQNPSPIPSGGEAQLPAPPQNQSAVKQPKALPSPPKTKATKPASSKKPLNAKRKIGRKKP